MIKLLIFISQFKFAREWMKTILLLDIQFSEQKIIVDFACMNILNFLIWEWNGQPSSYTKTHLNAC